MLMAVNIGNSRISVGFFAQDACRMLFRFQVSTDVNKTSEEYGILFHSLMREQTCLTEPVRGVVLSSVVPQITEVMRRMLMDFTGIPPLVVGAGMKTGFPIKIDNPSELGGDMVANAAAVLYRSGETGIGKGGAVLVDMGTVTTISAINRSGEYVGCCIVPGIAISLEALHGKTAQLPNVILSAPQKAIGKNSQESIRSGVILGHAIMLDGFVGRFAKELRCDAESLTRIITGEYAKAVMPACKRSFVYEENLTLEGLFYLYRHTVQHNERS